jgi:hypothetical protein
MKKTYTHSLPAIIYKPASVTITGRPAFYANPANTVSATALSGTAAQIISSVQSLFVR